MVAGVRRDIYIVGQSSVGKLERFGQEIRLDLSLEPSPYAQGGTISGTVRDDQGRPVPGATVKIMDSSHNPVAHTFTDTQGNYIFSPFPPSPEYHIYAVAPGYLLAEGPHFALNPNQSVVINLDLMPDPSALLCSIAGDVKDSSTGAAIEGAAINVFKVEGVTETLVSIAFTNPQGQFIVYDLEIGIYKIVTNAPGYVTVVSQVLADTAGAILRVTISMTADQASSRGTVSGIILDQDGNPIINAYVVLYRVETDGTLVAVARTKTNDEGLYLFTQVPKANYKVKATKQS